MEQDNVIVFDGVCNLCSRSVQFIIKRDPGGVFHFAPLQSDSGAGLLNEYGLDASDVKTFLLVRKGKAYIKSDAALEIIKEFHGGWKALTILHIIPGVVRNWCYDIIASNRHRWFGRKDTCMMPTDDIKERFLQ